MDVDRAWEVRLYIYAADLVGTLKKVWKQTKLYVQEEGIPPLPADPALRRLLDVAYHASLLTEEQRRPSFRVVCCPREEFETSGRSRTRSSVKITFGRPVPYNEKQLLQLAPATDPTSVLIAVEPAPKRSGRPTKGERRRLPLLSNRSGVFGSTASTEEHLQIWGLLDTGSSWWAHTRSESERIVHAPPDFLMVSSNKPGQLTISRAWRILLTLENGRLAAPPADVFLNGPVAQTFETPIRQVYEEVYKGYATGDPYEPLLNRHNCSVKFITIIKRLLTYLVDRSHGGILVMIPDETDAEQRVNELVSIKYECRHYELWSNLLECLRARRRWFEVGSAIARGNGTCSKAEVLELSRLRMLVEEKEHELTDRLQLVAALSGVDGAVFLTDRLRLLGFGAELRSRVRLENLFQAHDAMARQREKVQPESFGTRHRSAFRFCRDYPAATAFVHSQDGGMKAIKKVRSDVLFWDINPPND